MTRSEVYAELDEVYSEIIELINAATERGQFNERYFQEPFIKWYLELMDQKEKQGWMKKT